MASEKIDCSVVMIVKNEEQNLLRLLASLTEFREVMIVDSASSDSTVRVARAWGAKVINRPFDNFADQKNFAVEQGGCDWVFSLDADEFPDKELLGALKEELDKQEKFQSPAYRIKRKNFHFGRELKWAGQGNDFPLRIFRKGKGKFVGPVHEHLEIKGLMGTLPGALIHESNQSAGDYLDKLVLYSGLEAGTAQQKRNQTNVWHWGIKPALRFIYFYFFRLGFLDGFEGFLFHSLSSFYLVAKEGLINEERRPS